jgi:hypothetical protein
VSNFPAAPKLSPVWLNGTTDGVNWYLLEPFVYFPDAIVDMPITVPAGFVTDFASVPRALWNIYPPWDVYGPAAIVHDWLYFLQEKPRSYADDILREAMNALSVDFVTRQAIYEAVALAGGFAWDENARKKASGFKRMFVSGVGVT